MFTRSTAHRILSPQLAALVLAAKALGLDKPAPVQERLELEAKR